MTAHERLAEYLTWKGCSQSEFARVAKIHQTTVNKLLNDDVSKRRDPGLDVAVAIERATQDWPDGPIRPSEWVPEKSAEKPAA